MWPSIMLPVHSRAGSYWVSHGMGIDCVTNPQEEVILTQDPMISRRNYKTVDVFSSEPLFGNPVAVILDATGLSSERMQAIARWTNLSETTFVLPPDDPKADYRLRIFTPDRELPFAGHPTLGSAHAVIEAGICTGHEGRVLQQCGVGLVPVSIEPADGNGKLYLRMPPAQHRSLTQSEVSELCALLGHQVRTDPAPALIDVGAVWVVAEIENADSLASLRPDFAQSAAFERKLGATGISLYAAGHTGIEVRSFAPSSGVNEDPVCGSGNGSIADFRMRAGQIAPADSYTAFQGRTAGRDGCVTIRIGSDRSIFVGGSCVTTADGTILA